VNISQFSHPVFTKPTFVFDLSLTFQKPYQPLALLVKATNKLKLSDSLALAIVELSCVY